MIVLFSLLIAILGAYAGKDGTSKAWRRFGIPLAFVALAGLLGYGDSAWLLALTAIPLSLGYGIPDDTDEGSFLGRMVCSVPWYRDEKMCDPIVRIIIAILMLIPFYWVAPSMSLVTGFTIYGVVVWFFAGDKYFKNEGEFLGMLVEDLILYFALGAFGYYALQGGI